MRTSVAPSHGRNSASILRRHLPLVATLVMLAPAVAFAQATAPATNAAPAATDAAPAATDAAPPATDAVAVVAPGTVSSYTEAQAERGKDAYDENCTGCHGNTLGGGGEIPALAGKGFREHWFVGAPGPFFEYIHSNMPQGAAGSLEPQTYADIAAYLMSRNRVPAGETELPTDDASLANIVLPPLATE